MDCGYIHMNMTLEFEVSGGRVRSYDFTISGNSFKEIKDRAKTLYAEIQIRNLMTILWKCLSDITRVLIRPGGKFPYLHSKKYSACLMT